MQESRLENGHVNGIFIDCAKVIFSKRWEAGNLMYRLAAEMDWIIDLEDKDEGIGSDSDQTGPFAGIALGI